MISKTKLKELSAYKTQKICDMDDVFTVEGVKMCDEALKSDFTIRTICSTHEWLEANAQIIGAREGGMMVYEVSETELERISDQKTPNQVWMLLQRKHETHKMPDTEAAPSPLTLVLDTLQNPGNLGTIIRTADWFGIRNIVCSPNTVSCYNPKVVQSTMGSIFRTHIVYTDLSEFLSQCREQGMEIYGAMLNGDNIYQSDIHAANSVLVIGNESKGITPEVQNYVSKRLLIPNMGGTCESLNASVAAAIMCSELIRR